MMDYEGFIQACLSALRVLAKRDKLKALSSVLNYKEIGILQLIVKLVDNLHISHLSLHLKLSLIPLLQLNPSYTRYPPTLPPDPSRNRERTPALAGVDESTTTVASIEIPTSIDHPMGGDSEDGRVDAEDVV